MRTFFLLDVLRNILLVKSNNSVSKVSHFENGADWIVTLSKALKTGHFKPCPLHADQQGHYHQCPDNRLRDDDAHIADGRRQQESDQHFAGQFNQTGDQRSSGIAEALHTVAQDTDGGGQEIEDGIDFQVQGSRLKDLRLRAGGHQMDQCG